MVLDSGPGSVSSVKIPSLRTESRWAVFQRWVGKGAVVWGKMKEYDFVTLPPRSQDRSSSGVPGITQTLPPKAPIPIPPQTTSSGCPYWSDWNRWRSGWQRSQQLGRHPARVLTCLQFRYFHEGGLQ